MANFLIAMRDGRIIVQGEPSSMMTEQMMRTAFGVDAHIVADPIPGLCASPLAAPGYA
ncbi:MAG: hypothetical protein H3C34_29175 [Caldilineaceae bacterium]|nr:hypothetical protein [Caldilineaceae bacterium]